LNQARLNQGSFFPRSWLNDVWQAHFRDKVPRTAPIERRYSQSVSCASFGSLRCMRHPACGLSQAVSPSNDCLPVSLANTYAGSGTFVPWMSSREPVVMPPQGHPPLHRTAVDTYCRRRVPRLGSRIRRYQRARVCITVGGLRGLLRGSQACIADAMKSGN
jgi:hypothetical protein